MKLVVQMSVIINSNNLDLDFYIYSAASIKVMYLGLIISYNRIKINPKKVAAIIN